MSALLKIFFNPIIALCSFAFILSTSGIYSASFDCSKAETKTEKAICSDEELSELDEMLGKVYSKALIAINKTRNPEKQKESLKLQQRLWVTETQQRCDGERECLKRVTQRKIDSLSLILRISDSFKTNTLDTVCNSDDLKLAKSQGLKGDEPIEALAFGFKIQRLVKENDIEGLANLISDNKPYMKQKLLRRAYPFFEQKAKEEFLDFEIPCFQNIPKFHSFWIGRYRNQVIYAGSNNQYRITKFDIPEAFPETKKFVEGWKYQNNILHPLCFETNWKTGTSTISLEECLDNKRNTFEIGKEGEVSAKKESGATDFYTVLERVEISECQEMSKKIDKYTPPVKGQCLDSYLIKTGHYGFGSLSLNIVAVYGIFKMDDGKTLIIPIKEMDANSL